MASQTPGFILTGIPAPSASIASTSSKRNTPPEIPSFSNAGELVTFKIGSGTNLETFIVHKEVVYLHSPVLRAAFESGFIEGQTKTYVLDDTEPSTFRLLVQWLYTQQVRFFLSESEVRGYNGLDRSCPMNERTMLVRLKQQHWDLVRLWILADKFCIVGLQNTAIDEIWKLYYDWNELPYHCLSYVYSTLPFGNVLRTFIFELFFCYMPFCYQRDGLPDEFLQEMDVAFDLRYTDGELRPEWDIANCNGEAFRRLFHV